jgi:hypothetical protein
MRQLQTPIGQSSPIESTNHNANLKCSVQSGQSALLSAGAGAAVLLSVPHPKADNFYCPLTASADL